MLDRKCHATACPEAAAKWVLFRGRQRMSRLAYCREHAVKIAERINRRYPGMCQVLGH